MAVRPPSRKLGHPVGLAVERSGPGWLSVRRRVERHAVLVAPRNRVHVLQPPYVVDAEPAAQDADLVGLVPRLLVASEQTVDDVLGKVPLRRCDQLLTDRLF